MDNSVDILQIISAAYMDKVSSEIMECLRDEYMALQITEAECRRKKSSALIICMNKLEIEKQKFFITYKSIASKCGEIPEIENYISQVDKLIKNLSYQKNHLS